jgi:hypothetical protein
MRRLLTACRDGGGGALIHKLIDEVGLNAHAAGQQYAMNTSESRFPVPGPLLLHGCQRVTLPSVEILDAYRAGLTSSGVVP